MKVYLYYLIHKPTIDILKSRRLIDWIGVPVSEIDDVCFYGYTDDKKVAKKFESTRNMSIFKKITKNMDEDEYKALEDAYNYLHDELYPIMKDSYKGYKNHCEWCGIPYSHYEEFEEADEEDLFASILGM